ncbi:MAG: flagellar export protein FliJ [Bacillota bacterium]|nr:flagellar export protein FliJ [Thermoanaerobacteraceae bacterium]
MGRFYFRLEPVLKCRTVKEEQEVQALAQAQRDKETLEETLRIAAEEYGESLEQNGETLWELEQWAVYRDLLRRRVKLRIAELQEAVAEVDRCRAALLSARQDRLVVEKVKERRYAIFQAEEASKERRYYDELSQLAFQNRIRHK